MNIAAYSVLMFSLISSTLICIWAFRKKENKWLGVGAGFVTNTLILSVATIIFYKEWNVKEIERMFASLGILVFPFFIPINTIVNFYILEFVKVKFTRGTEV